jgi:hypothetical protein
MARITYQDDSITEYDDGTEEVRFTAEEWERMLADPAFGYVCRFGHTLRDADHRYGSCLACEHAAEAWLDDDDIAEALALGETDTDPAPAAAADVEPF